MKFLPPLCRSSNFLANRSTLCFWSTDSTVLSLFWPAGPSSRLNAAPFSHPVLLRVNFLAEMTRLSLPISEASSTRPWLHYDNSPVCLLEQLRASSKPTPFLIFGNSTFRTEVLSFRVLFSNVRALPLLLLTFWLWLLYNTSNPAGTSPVYD